MATEILRPNAAGDEENIPIAVGDGVGTHYTTVDEETPDEATTHLESFSMADDWTRDLYNLPASGGSGTINFIKVYVRASSTSAPTRTSLKIALKTGGTAYESSEITITTAWATYSNQWTTNPGGGAWTWAQINDLQIGENIRRPLPDVSVTYITQVYVEIDYTTTVIATSVGASSDDCHVYWNGSAWAMEAVTSPTQNVGYHSSGAQRMGGGVRFLNIAIPQGATIITAYLTFIAAASVSGTVVNSRITGDDEDNAATWTTIANYQARRGTVVGGANNDYITDAQVDWDAIPAWTAGDSKNSPSIVSIIQEIINRAGWASGNALALFWDDHDNRSTNTDGCYRFGASWDNVTYDPPALYIEYTPAKGRSFGYIIG